ncbi:hypothetical protein [Clostridium cadaveris]|uniref:hypothetical protein n=1 Tax=Clostridium cadaveris TaxID=1529 RepID=UPI0015B60EB7|nr:hypothetical protein [Clostridium cadaveris]NWK11334.1 hypothetical protein [Clostridium cadaveris]
MKNRENIFDKTEELLYEYRDIDIELREIELQIEEIELYKGCGAINYEEKTGQTFKINNPVEKEFLDKEKKLKKLEFEKKRLSIVKERVENALNLLSKDYKKIVELRYLTRPKCSWKKISEYTTMDKSTCSDICLNKIIPELAHILFKYH